MKRLILSSIFYGASKLCGKPFRTLNRKPSRGFSFAFALIRKIRLNPERHARLHEPVSNLSDVNRFTAEYFRRGVFDDPFGPKVVAVDDGSDKLHIDEGTVFGIENNVINAVINFDRFIIRRYPAPTAIRTPIPI